MRAAIVTGYGGPELVEVRDVPTPEPKAGEVLIKVRATTISAGDWRIRSGNVPKGFKTMMRIILGWNRPRQPILGSEIAGDIVAVGPGVSAFAVGDAVVAFPDFALGGHAQYKTMRVDKAIVRKPEKLDYAKAAGVAFGGSTALMFLRKGGCRSGDAVLVNGGSGAVGLAAIGLARHLGASVTAVTSAGNADIVRAAGAGTVIDYTAEDFAKGSVRYDMVMDCVGNAGFARVAPVLKTGGRLLQVVGGLPEMLAGMSRKPDAKKVIGGTGGADRADLELLVGLAADGTVVPHIDSEYGLEDIRSAWARVDSGRKRGCVVVRPFAADLSN